MNAIVVNNLGSKIILQAESYAIRTGYLLCNKVTAAGSTYHFIYYDAFEVRKTLEIKIESIEAFREREEKDMEGWSAAETKLLLKQMKKIKHPPPEAIKKLRKLEKSILDLYSDYAAEERRRLAGTGMIQLQELFEKNKDLPMYYIQPANNEFVNDGFKSMSKLLLLDIENRDRDCDFFCLTYDFFLNGMEHNEIAFSAEDEKAKTNGYLHACFTLPNLNFLSSLELTKVKEAINDAVNPFTEQADAWINAVYANENAEATICQFRETVLPSLPALQSALDDEPLIKHISRLQNDGVQMSILLGELPVAKVWNYYRQLEVMRDETWAVLEKEMEKDEFKNKRYPVMVMKMPEHIVPDKLSGIFAKETDVVMPVKKSIAID